MVQDSNKTLDNAAGALCVAMHAHPHLTKAAPLACALHFVAVRFKLICSIDNVAKAKEQMRE